MKTIIVPLDFSKESLSGLNYALMLANKTGANIQMVHVVNKNDIINIELHHVAKSKFEDILQVFKGKYNSNVTLSYTI
jgi:hypothetical protein